MKDNTTFECTLAGIFKRFKTEDPSFQEILDLPVVNCRVNHEHATLEATVRANRLIRSSQLLALGTAAILSTHAFVNIAMTIQAAPIIGIPLPFISYGGSFMFSTLALTGLCQSVHIRRHEHSLYS